MEPSIVRVTLVHELSDDAKQFLGQMFAPSGGRNQLDEILAGIRQLQKKETTMANEIQDLTSEVKRSTTVAAGVKALMVKIAAIIGAGDPVALRALETELKTNNDSIAADILANTPAEAVEPPAGV